MPTQVVPPLCERNGCSTQPTHRVTFRQHATSSWSPKVVTFACADHAAWWVRGIDGERIGSVAPIARRSR